MKKTGNTVKIATKAKTNSNLKPSIDPKASASPSTRDQAAYSSLSTRDWNKSIKDDIKERNKALNSKDAGRSTLLKSYNTLAGSHKSQTSATLIVPAKKSEKNVRAGVRASNLTSTGGRKTDARKEQNKSNSKDATMSEHAEQDFENDNEDLFMQTSMITVSKEQDMAKSSRNTAALIQKSTVVECPQNGNESISVNIRLRPLTEQVFKFFKLL